MNIMRIGKQVGFTIVELIIVIVVIGILASITIVAYNGVQARAEASKTISAIQAYKKALQLYYIDNSAYPGTGAFCLGDQYPSLGGGTAGCRYSTSIIANTVGASSRDLLKPYLGGSLPMPSTKALLSGTTEFVGGHFYGSGYNYTLDGAPIVTIEYYVNGTTCPVGPVYSATPPNFSSPAVDRSAAIGSNGSRCFMLLPQ